MNWTLNRKISFKTIELWFEMKAKLFWVCVECVEPLLILIKIHTNICTQYMPKGYYVLCCLSLSPSHQSFSRSVVLPMSPMSRAFNYTTLRSQTHSLCSEGQRDPIVNSLSSPSLTPSLFFYLSLSLSLSLSPSLSHTQTNWSFVLLRRHDFRDF